MSQTSTRDRVPSQLTTKVEGIGHLLMDRLLSVPDYQRSYSWTNDEVQELWDDLSKAMASGAPEYFLGSVVTTSTGSKRDQVIDGQQRLATISLLYAAMRDILASRSDERAEEIQRDFLGRKNMATREVEPNLTLNAEDNNVFRQLISNDASKSDGLQRDSHQRLYRAYCLLHGKLDALVSGRSADDWQKPLISWHQFLLEQAMVIDVNVASENRAFVIFETLNDRGLNLSTSDLLKNHIFGTSNDRLDECKNFWSRAMAPFSGERDSGDADAFLRHFWASKQGVARVKALFSQIRSAVDTPQDAVSIASELAQSAPLWSSMFDRDGDFWKAYPSASKDALETLGKLKVEQCRPLLLAVMRKFPEEEVSIVIKNLVSWSIRWFVVGGGSAGSTERLYAEAAKGVSDGSITNASEVVKAFVARIPNDREFEASFSTHTVRRGWLARYYLAALERAANAKDQPELVPNRDSSEVNLEHVLPKRADPSDWPVFSESDLSDMKLMLGNQVLLSADDNTRLNNGPFESKRSTLQRSQLTLTREVGNCSTWEPSDIRKRQIRLAALAVETWRREAV